MKLSRPMRRVLANLFHGEPVIGRRRTATLAALRLRGLVDEKDRLTQAGSEAAQKLAKT